MSQKVYDIITSKIIESLENDIVPWQKPWKGASDIPRNFVTGKPYRGLNVFMLQYAALEKNYTSPLWLTFKQISNLKAHLRKGSKSEIVMFWKIEKKETKKVDGTTEERTWPLIRFYKVFNASCVEWPDKFADKLNVERPEFNSINECERIVDSWEDKPEITFGGDKAFYSWSLDKIRVPNKEDFETPEHYYATLFHEMVHSTGHESRLKRDHIAGEHFFGSVSYSKEELIAEMGAAFLCGHVGIESHIIDNASAYIKSWLKVLKSDSKFVIQAATKAQAAADYILGDLVNEDEEGEE